MPGHILLNGAKLQTVLVRRLTLLPCLGQRICIEIGTYIIPNSVFDVNIERAIMK